MPSDTRSNINEAVQSLRLEAKDFKFVSVYTYEEILLKVLEKFTKLGKRGLSYTWLWEHLKGTTFSIYKSDNLRALKEIVPKDEFVWFIVLNEGEPKDLGNFWVYESKIETIISIIGEAFFLNEYYIVSKKLEWLICENHHNCLIGVGEQVIDKMKSISEKF